MLLSYKNEIIIIYIGDCRNKHFESKLKGVAETTNKSKLNKVCIKRVYLGHKLYDSSRLFKPWVPIPYWITRGVDKFKWDKLHVSVPMIRMGKEMFGDSGGFV